MLHDGLNFADSSWGLLYLSLPSLSVSPPSLSVSLPSLSLNLGFLDIRVSQGILTQGQQDATAPRQSLQTLQFLMISIILQFVLLVV